MKRFIAIVAATLLLVTVAGAETMTCIVAKGQYVNVRNQPRNNAEKVGELRNGETIEVEDIKDGYIQITFKEKTAYVSAKYFETEETAHYTVVADGRVRVRNNPGGERVDWLQPGESVRVFGWRYSGDGEKWARLSGSEYVAAEYLTKEAEDAAQGT